MKKSKKLTMNIGIISFLTVFVIICLVTFAVLSLVSAKSNVDLSQRSIDHKTEYYELCNRGEAFLKKLDDQLYENYSQTNSKNEYFTLINKISQIDERIKIDNHMIQLDIINNKQKLHIELEVLYPGQKFYQLKVWDMSSSQEWNPDNKLNIL